MLLTLMCRVRQNREVEQIRAWLIRRILIPGHENRYSIAFVQIGLHECVADNNVLTLPIDHIGLKASLAILSRENLQHFQVSRLSFTPPLRRRGSYPHYTGGNHHDRNREQYCPFH